MLILRTPTELRIRGHESKRDLLSKKLGYVDKKVDWALRKHKAGRGWFCSKFGEQAFVLRLEELTKERNKSILFEDQEGVHTYTGVHPMLSDLLDDKIQRGYDLPDPKLIPWSNEPKNKPRYYQEGAAEALIAASVNGPAAVEMGTGLGKSFILQMLLKRLGLKSLVMAPSKSIAEQLYDEMVFHFGKAKVGYYGDGSKESNRLFTIGIGASLTKIEPDSKAWKDLSQCQVFIADESHMCPATTLAKVCFGFMANAPYRFFFSGTQIRNDGLDLVLDGITGPIVYRMTVKQGVEQGFLSKPLFRMCWTKSNVSCFDNDPNELTRAHIYYNDELNMKAAELANKSVSVMGRPTLILVEEIEQFTKLLPHFRFEARFAHGGVTKENKDKLPEQYHKSEPNKLVEAFNAGEFPILVGTSCVATGTDLKATGAMLYLRGGKSETEVKQGVGRCTRLFPGKSDCIVIDFGIQNVDLLKKHADARHEIYDDIYPSYTELRI